MHKLPLYPYLYTKAQQIIEGRGARAGFLAHPLYIHTYILHFHFP
jgi:hypothetical protein